MIIKRKDKDKNRIETRKCNLESNKYAILYNLLDLDINNDIIENINHKLPIKDEKIKNVSTTRKYNDCSFLNVTSSLGGSAQRADSKCIPLSNIISPIIDKSLSCKLNIIQDSSSQKPSPTQSSTVKKTIKSIENEKIISLDVLGKKNTISHKFILDKVKHENITTPKAISLGDNENTCLTPLNKKVNKIHSDKQQYFKDNILIKHKKPQTSYGLILFSISGNDEIKFLVQKRRNSFEYIHFLCGYWETLKDIYNLMIYMTKKELLRMQVYSFECLWEDLWMGEKTFDNHKDLKNKAKTKFNNIKNPNSQFNLTLYSSILKKNNLYLNLKKIKKSIFEFLVEISLLSYSSKNCKKLLWGFPKGKKNIIKMNGLERKETNIECAIRECQEEIKINKNQYDIIKYNPYVEFYKGSDNKEYSTFYYIAKSDYCFKVKEEQIENAKIPDRCKTISDEVSKIKWVTIDEISLYISNKRLDIIETVYDYIKQNYLPKLKL
jgi:8-oxo-dGTP pyrophosphatase MutT (NUDIX family)